MLEHNVASLQRLKQCVSQPILYQTPQDDPNYTPLGHAPETPEEIANTPCSLSSTKVVLGSWCVATERGVRCEVLTQICTAPGGTLPARFSTWTAPEKVRFTAAVPGAYLTTSCAL